MGTLGYGTDFAGSHDLTETMDEIEDPNSVRAIADAAMRRLDTPRGGLIDDETYGKDVRALLNKGLTAAQIDAEAREIDSEVEQDDRIEKATTTVTPGGTPLGSRLRVSIRIVPVDPRLGDFTLTFSATDAGLILEALSLPTVRK
jgi:hypothetical protein